MFRNRQEAGIKLAERLRSFKTEKPIILGLPRGGVPIAAEIAKILQAPLDVVVVRKVGVPWNSELGVGAVGPGVEYLDEDSMRSLGLTRGDLKPTIEFEKQEVKRRLELYRGHDTPPEVSGRTVILVDDGLATGVTAKAALQTLKSLKPKRLILAVPVGPLETVNDLKKYVDELICLETPQPFYAVGAFYNEFPQVSDDQVIEALQLEKQNHSSRLCEIQVNDVTLLGDLTLPNDPKGLVVFAHGSGSSRLSPRNQFVASALNEAGLGTLLFDLLTQDEEKVDQWSAEYRFNIPLLATRLEQVARWVHEQQDLKDFSIGFFGASTGAAAALMAEVNLPQGRVKAIVSRGGRPDLAEGFLEKVKAATLLIVGGWDTPVIDMNESAAAKLVCEHEVIIVPEATHLFEEPGKLEEVSRIAIHWFQKFL